MKNKIKIVYGIDKKGNDLFYCNIGFNREITIYKKEASKELNIELLKSILEPTDEEIEYIKGKYNEWYRTY